MQTVSGYIKSVSFGAVAYLSNLHSSGYPFKSVKDAAEFLLNIDHIKQSGRLHKFNALFERYVVDYDQRKVIPYAAHVNTANLNRSRPAGTPPFHIFDIDFSKVEQRIFDLPLLKEKVVVAPSVSPSPVNCDEVQGATTGRFSTQAVGRGDRTSVPRTATGFGLTYGSAGLAGDVSKSVDVAKDKPEDENVKTLAKAVLTIIGDHKQQQAQIKGNALALAQRARTIEVLRSDLAEARTRYERKDKELQESRNYAATLREERDAARKYQPAVVRKHRYSGHNAVIYNGAVYPFGFAHQIALEAANNINRNPNARIELASSTNPQHKLEDYA